MTEFLLMRHAEPDYTWPQSRDTKGWGNDLAPLSKQGVEQVAAQTSYIKEWSPQIVLLSPTTRTMQTGALVLHHLDCPFEVEFDLHEWIPDLSFSWKDFSDISKLLVDFYEHKGTYPLNGKKPWEEMSSVRKRVLRVLTSYLTYDRILVVAHGIVIESLTGVFNPPFTSFVTFQLSEGIQG